MNDNREYQCNICNEQREEGQGIRIVTGFICESCEAEMVKTDVKDAKYPFFIHQMKQIFLSENA
ncbi:sigma factor G inhibitor Gin [Paenibacillus sinopodophylli]|uniref:sigma factor G inhibitor Gin n=1 Tax=Paenibacillus sinopodophylli TaxID=1837342 RepID=UPI00110CE93C|nr:sigma factor G inhibitor Gin [Paenibacillus sinopodophylli]